MAQESNHLIQSRHSKSVNYSYPNVYDETDVFEMRALGITCDLCEQRMQAVADLLLLTSDTRAVRTASLSVFGESVARCRETIASRNRGLIVLLRDLAALFLRETSTKMAELRCCIEEICELVVSVTECCAQVGYLLSVLTDGSTPEAPGPVDRYQLCRATAEIEHKAALLTTYKLDTITALQLTDICISVSDSAHILTNACLKAADEALNENTREQFRLCLKSVASSVNTFTASVNFLKDKPNEHNYRACQVFGEGLTTASNALTVFATQDDMLTGQPASLSDDGQESLNQVLSACMGVVSPCILACSVIKDMAKGKLVAEPRMYNNMVIARLQQCQTAVISNANKLANILIGHKQS